MIYTSDNLKFKQNGFSIVEVMISVFIGLILLTGLVTIFETTSTMNKTQNGLARLQENGRFATLHMKNVLDQAGYQYCNSSSYESYKDGTIVDALGSFENYASIIQPWKIFNNQTVFPGVPNTIDPAGLPGSNALFDPRYFIHGHECSNGTCTPNFSSAGTDISYSLPLEGTGNGDRIAGTDVITVRYIQGAGRAVQDIIPKADITVESTQTLTYELYEDSGPNAQFPIGGTQVLIAGCGVDNTGLHVITNLISGSTGSATFSSPIGQEVRGGAGESTRVFDLQRDVRSVTYYVANNIVNGRDIPTLYSVINGTVNALIEGVDRFDILYRVQTRTRGSYVILDAAGVEAMPEVLCIRVNDNLSPTGNGQNPGPGCGWNSVVAIEFHMLLNTVQDSGPNGSEIFYYSLDGDQPQTEADLPSAINHYNLHRKEFYSVVATKNWN